MGDTTANKNKPPKGGKRRHKHKDAKPPLVDEREVYMALRKVLNGYNNKNFGRKRLRPAIEKTQTPAVKDLLKRHDILRVRDTAQKLLGDQVFMDSRFAQEQFPDLFEISSDGTVKEGPEPTEAAAHLEASPIKNVGLVQSQDTMMMMSQLQWHPETSGDSGEDTLIWTSGDQIHCSGIHASASSNLKEKTFDAFIPMKSQYHLLNNMQTLLESACFEFAKRVIPATLEFKGWDCPEAVELNVWVTEFTRNISVFNEGDTEELCRSMAHLRHTAVHRRRVPVEVISQFLRDAERFMGLLGDAKRAEIVSKLYQDTYPALEELKKQKRTLGSRLEETMKAIEAKRAELRKLEADVKADVGREGHEYEHHVGTVVDDALSRLAVTSVAEESHEMVPESTQTDAMAGYVSEGISAVQEGGDLEESTGQIKAVIETHEVDEDEGIEKEMTYVENKGRTMGIYERSVNFIYGLFY